MAAAQNDMYPAAEADNGRETPRPFSQRPTTSATGAEDYQYQVNGTESITSGQEPGPQDGEKLRSPVPGCGMLNCLGYVVERSSRFQPGEVRDIIILLSLTFLTPSILGLQDFLVRASGRWGTKKRGDDPSSSLRAERTGLLSRTPALYCGGKR